MNNGLKCGECGSNLLLKTTYTGTDWECVAGAGSKHDYLVSLNCEKCQKIYKIAYAKNQYDLSPVKGGNT